VSTTLKQSFTPVRVGRYTLPNRLVMAPMTRSRAKYDGTPGDLAAEYYAQRASVGLIVTEGTQPSDDGQGYLATPGIYTPAHIAGWQKVTRAVHENDGHIFIQMIGQRRSGLQPHPSHSAGFAIADRARRGVHAVSFGRAYSNTELAALGNFVLAHFGGKQGNLTQEDVAKHRTQ
jgi:2,4-dienoyl-CoA reductase-like NADH-dependent reductase (Old Yellow Enzyme family)